MKKERPAKPVERLFPFVVVTEHPGQERPPERGHPARSRAFTAR